MENIQVLFLLVSFPLLVIFLSRMRKSPPPAPQPPLPPGPKPWPLVGCIPQMLRSHNSPTFRWLHRMMDEFNTHILCVRLGNVHVISISCPEIAREFFTKHDHIFASRPDFMSTYLMSSGYLTVGFSPSDSQQWKKMKAVMVSLLTPARHRWLQDKRAAEADHLVTYIYNQCGSFGSGLVKVRFASRHYCGNVMRQLVFGKRFFGTGAKDGGPGVEEIEHVDGIFTIIKYIFSFTISDYLPLFRWTVDLDGHESIMRKAIQSLRKYQDPEVDDRIQQWQKGSRKQKEDLLDVLISLRDKDDNPLLSSNEIKAQIAEMMIATVDSPANVCEWALAEMLNKPEMLQKATEELDRVVGKNRLVQESDIPHLNYLKACAKEVFRLHPLAPFNLPHVSTEDATVSGYFIPKGSHVLLSRPGLGRNSNIWKDPLKFDPERHLGAEVVLTDHDLRIISFSTGRRGCIGATLGTAITVMLLARLFHSFSWQLPANELSVDLSESYETMLLTKPLIAMAKPRLAAHLYNFAKVPKDSIDSVSP